jgi:ankyrin repeat protein
MRPAIYDRIEERNLHGIAEYLACGGDPIAVDPAQPMFGVLKTAISEVSEGGPIDMITLLLRHHFPVNYITRVGDASALIVAVLNGHLESIRLLLAAGAEIELKDEEGGSPLLLAVQEENVDAVQLLLLCSSRGTIDFSELLGLAVSGLNIEIVCMLLSAGADPENCDYGSHAVNNLPSADGTNAHKRGLVSRLIEQQIPKPNGLPVAEKDLADAASKAHTLHLETQGLQVPCIDAFKAIGRGDVEALKRFLIAGGDPNAVNPLRPTLTLLIASIEAISSQGGPVDMITLLLKYRAKINVDEGAGTVVPLLIAVKNAHLDSIRLLLARGADVTTKDEFGSFPLLIGVQKRNMGLVELLLICGAEVTVNWSGGPTGRSPLGEAVANLDLRMICRLLDSGAEREKVDKNGKTPIDYIPDANVVNVVDRELCRRLICSGN